PSDADSPPVVADGLRRRFAMTAGRVRTISPELGGTGRVSVFTLGRAGFLTAGFFEAFLLGLRPVALRAAFFFALFLLLFRLAFRGLGLAFLPEAFRAAFFFPAFFPAFLAAVFPALLAAFFAVFFAAFFAAFFPADFLRFRLAAFFGLFRVGVFPAFRALAFLAVFLRAAMIYGPHRSLEEGIFLPCWRS
ncbi:MAG: hypothetical protein ACX98W_19360, partial [bacterium]